MDGDVAPIHAAKLHGHRHSGKRFALAVARKHMVIVREPGQALEQLNIALLDPVYFGGGHDRVSPLR